MPNLLESRTPYGWRLMIPALAVVAALLVAGLVGANYTFLDAARTRDLARARTDARLAARLIGAKLGSEAPERILADIRSAGVDNVQWLPAGENAAVKGPRQVTPAGFVDAVEPVLARDGKPGGHVRIIHPQDSTRLALSTLRYFAAASIFSALVLLAIVWISARRSVFRRIDRLTAEFGNGAVLAERNTRPDDPMIALETAARTALGRLRHELEHARRLLAGHTEAACLGTRDGTLLEVNDAYCRFFGKSREQLVGTNYLDLIPPADRTEALQSLRKLSPSSPRNVVEHGVLMPDGSTRFMRWQDIAVFDANNTVREVLSFGTDITPEHEARGKLADMQRAYDQMQSLSSTGSVIWDFAADRLQVTPEAARLLFPDAPRVAVGAPEDLLAKVHGEDRGELRQLLQRAREKGDPFQCEFRVLLPGGGLRHLQARGEVAADDKTKLLAQLTCTLRDITDLREAEAATKRELRFREAVEQSLATGIIVSDENGCNRMVNPAFCEMTGWTSDELVGLQAPYPYWPEEEIPTINAAFEQALRGETPRAGFELKFCRKDGTRFDVLVKVAPLLDSDDHQLGWLGAVSDISAIQETRRELTKTGQQLRQQLNYLQTVEKNILVGLITIGADGRPLSVNDTYCRMLGYTREEIMAMGPPYPLWPEEDREEIQRAFDMHLQGKAPPGGFQLRFKKKDGSLVDVLISVSALNGADGAPIGILSSLTDISPLKEAERRLNAVNQRLQIAQDVAEFGIWDWDPDADTLFWDRNSFAMFGHPEATEPKAVWNMVHDQETRERLTQELRRLIDAGGKSGQDHLSIRWPDGSTHEILSTYIILRAESGRATRVFGVNRDITAELEQQSEFRNTQERLSAALEGGNFGTFEHVIGVGDRNYNPANYEINGIDPSITEPGALFAAWKEVTGDFFPKLMAEISSLPVAQNTYTYEFTARPRGKETRRVRVSVFIERDGRGQPVRLVGVTRRLDA